MIEGGNTLLKHSFLGSGCEKPRKRKSFSIYGNLG